MAKILLTAFLADIRGKVNGTVFSKNKGGAYARTKVTPTNPRSVGQTVARSSLASISSQWRALTEAQREAWKTFAASNPYNDVFGNQKYLSGNQSFMKTSLNLSVLSTPSLVFPVEGVPQPQIFSAEGYADATHLILGVESDLVAGGDWKSVIKATGPISAGISNFTSSLAILATDLDIIGFAGLPGGFSITSQYVSKYGVLGDMTGRRIGMSVYFVNVSTGQATVPVEVSVIVP